MRGMPHAIFFTQRGHSIHGSDHPGLGTAVSHGCVRLTLSNAATLYHLVQSVGVANAKVVVSGRDPPGYSVPTMPPRQPVGLFGGIISFLVGPLAEVDEKTAPWPQDLGGYLL